MACFSAQISQVRSFSSKTIKNRSKRANSSRFKTRDSEDLHIWGRIRC